ncbi:MAG: Hpt domain-containing protein [Gemmatimonadaceae bacterium]|nr:Hpt domain-containing protein [Gemmatimonadaceae bacterium]
MPEPANARLQLLIASLDEALLIDDERALIALANRVVCQGLGVAAPQGTRGGVDGSLVAEEGAIDFTLLEAQTLGQPEFTVEMIDVYLESLTPQWEAVRAAGADMDRPALHAAAHKLKSASAVVGANALRETLEHLEDVAPSASLSQVAFLIHVASMQGNAVRRSLTSARLRYQASCAGGAA